MLFKILSAIGCIIIGLLIGFKLGYKYVLREKFLTDIVAFLDYYSGEINFNKTKLKELLDNFCENCGEELRAALLEFNGLIRQNTEIATGLLESDCYKALDKEEAERLKQLLCSLGTSDSETQANMISSYREYFSKKQAEAFAEKKKYSSLYYKLGGLVGIGAGILLI